MKLRTVVLVMAIVVSSFAMAGTSRASSDVGSASGASFRVSIRDSGFYPNILSVHVGDTVSWRNKGTVSHTSTARSGVWNSGVLSPGQTFSFTFTTTGNFKYRCNIHPQMLGRIIVDP